MSFTLYGHYISQPVRAVKIYADIAEIPFEFHFIDIFKGEHKTEEFAKINPF